MEGRDLDALRFAAEAHSGQIYRGYDGRQDEPYICHPIRVAARLTTESERVVALLHDVLEDTDVEPPAWMSGYEAEALDLLTHRDGWSYEQYIQRIRDSSGRSGELARAVKVADLMDNLANHPPDRLTKRYANALQSLSPDRRDDEPEDGWPEMINWW